MVRKRDPVSGRLLLEGIHPRVSPATGVVTYRARLSWVAGGQRQHESRSFKDARAAEDWLSTMHADIRHGRQLDVSDVTVADYYAQWLARKRSGWSGSRLRTVEMVWTKYARDYFGTMLVCDVTRHDVQRFVDLLGRKRLSPPTIQTYSVGIRDMLDDAFDDGLIPHNPVTRIVLPRKVDVERETWSPLQMRRFLQLTKDDATFGPLWAFLVGTGCRLGEALALEWSSVDLATGTATIRSRISRQHDGLYAPQRGTKTDARGRTVPLETWLIDALRTRKACEDGPYVFHEGGVWLRQGRVRYRWQQAVEASGLPRIRIHDIRHSVATAMIASGVSERIVQEILGHKDISITMGTYGHVSVRTQRQGTGVLAEVLGFGDDPAQVRQHGRKPG